jgi:ABC-type branched-subunit amino acid transport system substrate-binding protein
VRVPVRLRVHDTAGDLATAIREARRAVLEEGCRILLGPLRRVTTLGAGAVAQAYGVPLLAGTVREPEVRAIGEWVLTLDPSPEEFARPLAEVSVNLLGGRRFGVLLPREDLAESFERAFREAVEELGGRVVLALAYEPEETDFRPLLERFEEAGVDALYVPASPAELRQLAPQLEFYEFHRRILGHGGWTHPEILDPGNPALEGAVFAVPAAEDPSSAFRVHLRAAVWERARSEVSRFHLRGYRSMALVLAALDAGAREGEEILEVLRHRERWEARPAAERVELVTFRDGVLGPATWAGNFDLTPREPPEHGREAGGPQGTAGAAGEGSAAGGETPSEGEG